MIGNLVLALIFGGGLLVLTLFVFAGHPQLWLFIGFSLMAMVVVFTAGIVYDQDRRLARKRHKKREKRAKRLAKIKRRKQFEYQL